MNVIYIGIITVIALVLFKNKLFEGFEWVTNIWSNLDISQWDRPTWAPYRNLCLTKNNTGYHSPAYTWWQNRDDTIKKEYQHCQPNWIGSTQQRCNVKPLGTSSFKNYPAPRGPSKTKAHSIATEYYHNPVAYCKKNPTSYPCPNFWIEDPQNAQRGPNYPTENMRIPALKDTIEPQVLTSDDPNNSCYTGLKVNPSEFTLAGSAVNDNTRMLILHPDREDHGLCPLRF